MSVAMKGRPTSKPIPSPEMLRMLLRYEPDTGELFWRERQVEMFADGQKYDARKCAEQFNRNWSGKEAFTSVSPSGYRQGTIWCRRYSGHRVVWAIAHGEWPTTDVDHINGIGSDNRIANLRLASHRQNMANITKKSPSRSRFKGVSPARQENRWRAQIKVNYRYIHLGTFSQESDAARAYDKAARLYFGAFANCNFKNNEDTP